jgi:hypothetical protein
MSHLTNEQVMSVPGMSTSLWRYQRTTQESIPLFWYKEYNKIDILDLVDIKEKDAADVLYNKYWVTPKGFPRHY